ncbi:hemerythrin domain-containing protein [Nocardioides sp. T2.26MG-1]|uniref:hemerythrin domain-containing protein n=1 Tax=Nocardioides sp. T2.26MG-1 TaxID=3041166 RepID=UPI0025413B73|nr:hemerythrin domain-containing protein [Nocardioides sp. T2.26MG-1]
MNEATRDTELDATTPMAVLEREHQEVDAGLEYFVAHGIAGAPQLRTALAALRRHIFVEEECLFPMLQDPALRMPLFVMLTEHRDLWRTMDEIDAALDGDGPGDRLQVLGRTLLAQLDRHNSKEEPIIYAHAATALPPEAAASLTEVLETARVPVGWSPGPDD